MRATEETLRDFARAKRPAVGEAADFGNATLKQEKRSLKRC